MLAVAIGLVLGVPAAAQDAAKVSATMPDRIVLAILRNDLMQGAYKVLEAPWMNTLFVASAPGFKPQVPGYVDLFDPDDLHHVRSVQRPRKAFALGMDHARGRLFVGNALDGSLSIRAQRDGAGCDPAWPSRGRRL